MSTTLSKDPPNLHVVTDASCTFCVCDDIDYTVKDNSHIVEAKRAYVLGKARCFCDRGHH
jgi:hypothetical protein